MMIWSSDDHRAYRIGEAIVNLCLALGGWVDWGADGKVRLLSKRNGRVGMFFPAWLVEGMKENRDLIKKYFDLIRAGENDNRDRVRDADDWWAHPPGVGSVRQFYTKAKMAALNETN